MLMRPRGITSSSGGGGGGKTGPANIGLLTNYVSHNAATSCRDALVAGGHTVTLIADNVVGSTDYSSYDIVITSRTEHVYRSTIASKLNELNDAGMPLIVGTVEAGVNAGPYLEMLPTVMGITGSITLHSSETEVVVVDNQHSVTLGTDPGTNTLFAVANYLGTVSQEGNHIGAALANGRSGFYAAIIAMEAGTARLNAGTSLGARIVMFPTYLISGAYTELHRTLLNQAVEWAI